MATRYFITSRYRRINFTDMLVTFLTLKTLITGNSPVEYHFIAHLQIFYLRTDFCYYSCAFMSHNQWFAPRLRIPVGMADTCGVYLYQYLVPNGCIVYFNGLN